MAKPVYAVQEQFTPEQIANDIMLGIQMGYEGKELNQVMSYLNYLLEQELNNVENSEG